MKAVVRLEARAATGNQIGGAINMKEAC